jgi:hypothetical protein
VDLEALAAQETNLYSSQYGRLDVPLYDLLQTTTSSTPIDVVIWLHEPPSSQPSRPMLTTDPNAPKPTPADVDTLYDQVRFQRSSFVSQLTQPVLQRLLPYGYPAAADDYAPAIYASLPPEVIGTVNTWPEVDLIYLAPINDNQLHIAVPTINGNVVQGRGITGAGVRIAQVEVGGRVAVANPNLVGVLQDNAFVCAANSGHSTGVAGILVSVNGVDRGVSPGASLRAAGSCGGLSNQLTQVSTAAANWGARAFNLSWGADTGRVPGANDRFYDNMVLNLWRTVVVAAGNNGLTNGNVLSPALAYNVIAVGNFDDRRTVAWADDVMNPTSSFRDPISWIGDRQKPEVAAPGTDITSTTTVAPWIGVIGSGTSFAAPMVTGGAALLIQRNGFFSVWPESVKALLMVTAVHNIEGATRLSDRDGAGGIVLDRADDVAGGVTGGSSGQGYNCAAPVNTNIAVVRLAGGILTRVAIVWDNDPTYVNYVTRPSADLDLQVIDPNGFVAAQSLSWDNTYEIVEFTPPANGNYTLRVNKFRCNQTPKWLGWAWRQGN